MKEKPNFTVQDWAMIKGYKQGLSGGPPESSAVAYMHGYRNGRADATGVVYERASVLRRRAKMIPGITTIGEPGGTGGQGATQTRGADEQGGGE